MNNGIPIKELLAEAEGATLDFKSTQYRLDDDRLKAFFIKDILSMANTPRQRPGYIVLGVKAFPDGRKNIIGVDRHHDDADLQQLVAGKTEPCPAFRYVPLEYDGKMLAAIEILPRRGGPYSVKRPCAPKCQTLPMCMFTLLPRGLEPLKRLAASWMTCIP